MTELALTEAQRRAVGGRLSTAIDAIRRLRGVGFESDALDALELALAEVADTTGAYLRRDGPSVVQAAIAQLLVVADELRPRWLAGYGDMDEASAQYLEQQAARLAALTDAVLEPLADTSPAARTAGTETRDGDPAS